MKKKWIFVGPTLVDSKVSLTQLKKKGYIVLPPIKRGDLPSIVTNNSNGRIVIVDGVFQDFPSVGHKEILYALQNDWDVWGLASMGAIRAAEMDTLGMKGFGEVYKLFKEKKLDDDEVALLFAPEELNYKPMTEPLIHFRIAIENFIQQRIISDENGKELVKTLKEMWFGYRTKAVFERLLIDLNLEEHKCKFLLSKFNKFRIKSKDLRRFILQHD